MNVANDIEKKNCTFDKSQLICGPTACRGGKTNEPFRKQKKKTLFARVVRHRLVHDGGKKPVNRRLECPVSGR